MRQETGATSKITSVQSTTRKRRMLCALVGTVVIASTHALSTSTTHVTKPSLEEIVDYRQEFDFVAQQQGESSSAASGPLAMSPLADTSSDECSEFELQLGRAIDTLRRDYPGLLQRPPDYRIYSSDLVTIDPSGVKLNGLKNYQNAFRLVHTVVNLFYCPEESLLTFRMVYDHTRGNLRVSWNVAVNPKSFFGRQKLHVDGISVYEFDRSTGKIVEHRVEKLVMNNSFVRPKHGVWLALKNQANEPDSIPVLCTESKALVKFQPWNNWGKHKSLFDTRKLTALSAATEDSISESDMEIDFDALERKNMSRKKFGLKPLTPDEFMELQTKVHQMEVEAKQRQSSTPSSSDATNYPAKKKKGLLKGLFGILEDTCETNFDCVRPELCCDFGFKKMCCSSGSMISTRQPDAMQPIRVVAGYPPGTVPDDW